VARLPLHTRALSAGSSGVRSCLSRVPLRAELRGDVVSLLLRYDRRTGPARRRRARRRVRLRGGPSTASTDVRPSGPLGDIGQTAPDHGHVTKDRTWTGRRRRSRFCPNRNCGPGSNMLGRQKRAQTLPPWGAQPRDGGSGGGTASWWRKRLSGAPLP
jgi:hypothetical protein